MPHFNMASIYGSKGQYENAIEAMHAGLKRKPDLAEAITMLGMIYDHVGERIKAREQYKLAVHYFDLRLKQAQTNNSNRVNCALVFLLMENDNAGKEITLLLKEFPDDFTVQMLKDFNKERFLKEIFKLSQD